MPQPTFPPPTLVETPAQLSQLAAWLLDQPRVAVDTEANSMYVYREQVCLLQFSAAGRDYIVDPLALNDLSSLGPLFADPNIEKVFHAAEYDLISLYRDFGWECYNVFDTMIAARTLGWEKVGLANLLETLYRVTLDKKYQRADWGARPLTQPMLAYARLDTHYLLDLRDRLHADLTTHEHLAEAEEDFERIARGAVRLAQQHANPEENGHTFWRAARGQRLNSAEATRLMLLYEWREALAEQLNRPPFKIMADSVLVQMAQQPPTSAEELQQVRGVGRELLRRNTRELLQVLAKARTTPAPPRPNFKRADPAFLCRFEVLKKWRKAQGLARGVEADVILCKEALQELATIVPTTPAELETIPSLGPVRRERYGAELLQVLVDATDCEQAAPKRWR